MSKPSGTTRPPSDRHLYRRLQIVAIAALSLSPLLPGCGSGEPTGEVAGTLTLRGTPVSQGAVVFFREPGVPAGAADLDATGGFRLSDPLPTGTYQVAFFFDDGAVAGAPVTSPPRPRPEVPSKYWNETTSGLTVTVREGDNTVSLDMQ